MDMKQSENRSKNIFNSRGQFVLPKNTFTFATQYYRMVPMPEDWERDLARIKEMGFDTIRLWALWQWAEQQPGDYYFDDLHDLLKLARRHDLDCILVTVLDQCPAWVSEKAQSPVINLNGSTGHGIAACWDAPAVRKLGERFLRRLCAELGGYDHLKVWDVWNEATKDECRCEHTRKHFEQWLRQRYGTVVALNKATYETRYRSWEDVTIPASYWQTPMWMLYQEFRCQGVAEQVGWAYEIVKGLLPDRCVAVHCHCDEHPFVHKRGGSQRRAGWDDWALGKATDFYITGEHEFYQGEGAYSRLSNMAACVANLEAKRTMTGGRFWSTGMSGGASKIPPLNLLTPVRPKENLFSLWTCVAHEARGIIYWQYRVERLRMPEAPGWGLTSFDGGETYRTEESRQFISALRPHEIGLVRARAPQSGCAVLYSLRSHILSEVHEHLNYIASFEGACFALWMRNLTADVVTEEDDLAPYRFIYLPMTHSLAESTVQRLIEFVRRGGTLVIEAATASSGPTGILHNTIPGYGLAEAAGIRELDTLYEPACKFRTRFGALPGVGEQRIFAVDAAKVIGSYPGGQPAATENRFGKGRVIYLSTNVAGGIRKSGSLKEIETLAKLTGLVSPITVSPLRPITARVLENDEERFVFVFNHSEKHETAGVQFPFSMEKQTLIHCGESQFSAQGPSLSVKMNAREVLVLKTLKTAGNKKRHRENDCDNTRVMTNAIGISTHNEPNETE